MVALDQLAQVDIKRHVQVSLHTHGAQVGEVGIHGGPGGKGIWGMPAAWLASDLVATTFPNHPTVAMTINEAT
jgi:hypothetical protein